MKQRPIIRRALAERDVQEAAQYYIDQLAPQAALDYVDDVEAALKHIQRNPATGSPRYAHSLSIPDLRFWRCKRFPYLVFYVEQADSIDVWRVLHGKRDIPTWLQDDPLNLS